MKLGKSAQTIFAQTHTLEASSGPTFYTLGFLVALILWSFGLVWLFFASASIAKSRSFPFNIGWWGFTFPLGVFATSTCQMGRELPSEFFKVLGTVCHHCLLRRAVIDLWQIISLCVVVLWMVVSIGTLKGVVSGKLFFAPCLADLKLKEEDKDVAKAA
jgi:tellurite resistance protein TehA-like permease